MGHTSADGPLVHLEGILHAHALQGASDAEQGHVEHTLVLVTGTTTASLP